MSYIIGIDSGGTKTVGKLYDIDGNVVMSSESGFGNFNISYYEGLKNIYKVIDNLLENFQFEISSIIIGLAGSSKSSYKDEAVSSLRERYKTNISIITDAELAYANLLKDEDGILVIAGTGSICIAMSNGIKKTIGGWGNILGDEGSGYSIAIKALKNLIKEYEYNNELSKLSNCILEYYKISDPNELKDIIYNSNKADIAKLSKVISKLDDQLVEDILVSEAKLLASSTINLVSKSKIIGLTGSLLVNNEVYRNAFIREINKRIESCEYIVSKDDNTYGAWILANKDMESKN